MSKPNKKATMATMLVFFCLFLFGVGFVVYMLNNSNSYTTTGERSSSVTVVSCTSTKDQETIFDVTSANSVENKVKISFNNNDKPSIITYTIYGVFDDEESALKEGGYWRTAYNLYMGEHDLNPESIENSFSLTGNKAWANLYTDASKLNFDTAKLFLFSPGENRSLLSYKMNDIIKIYEKNGFKCKTNDN